MRDLADTVDELAAEDLGALDAAELGRSLAELRHQIDSLEAEWHRRLGTFDRRGAYRSDEHRSAQSWLRSRCHMAHSTAHEHVRVARALRTHAPTAAAFAAGDIGYRHVQVITRATAGVGREAAERGEQILVEAARSLDPGRLRRVALHWQHALDPDVVADAAAALHARRRVHLSSTLHGAWLLDGLLDAEGGAIVATALDALMRPLPGDTRTAPQRRADALVELARRQLDGGGLPARGGERPHVLVTLDLQTLVRRAGSVAAELAWGEPIDAETARRLACDAGVSRIITNGSSRPLDVGRRTPTVPPSIRRALITRDGGCTHPGCDRPPEWTDAHHRVHWADGGPTSLENLVLLCRTHHRLVHEQERGGCESVAHAGEAEPVAPAEQPASDGGVGHPEHPERPPPGC
ncbi:MAG: DUF222 domain-containing protein [Acidimicrobiia bacterium]